MTSLWHIFLAYFPCTRPPYYPQHSPTGETLPPRRAHPRVHRAFLRAKRVGRKQAERRAEEEAAAGTPE
ncbi:hypothetical protein Q8F55_008217 [Vanrija albida]|uniref:Uncharacterized protein n=1 Tax=Vanrija albida TaxID=181172 RepID=A0ABR3PVR8_9TREE